MTPDEYTVRPGARPASAMQTGTDHLSVARPSSSCTPRSGRSSTREIDATFVKVVAGRRSRSTRARAGAGPRWNASRLVLAQTGGCERIAFVQRSNERRRNEGGGAGGRGAAGGSSVGPSYRVHVGWRAGEQVGAARVLTVDIDPDRPSSSKAASARLEQAQTIRNDAPRDVERQRAPDVHELSVPRLPLLSPRARADAIGRDARTSALCWRRSLTLAVVPLPGQTTRPSPAFIGCQQALSRPRYQEG